MIRNIAVASTILFTVGGAAQHAMAQRPYFEGTGEMKIGDMIMVANELASLTQNRIKLKNGAEFSFDSKTSFCIAETKVQSSERFKSLVGKVVTILAIAEPDASGQKIALRVEDGGFEAPSLPSNGVPNIRFKECR